MGLRLFDFEKWPWEEEMYEFNEKLLELEQLSLCMGKTDENQELIKKSRQTLDGLVTTVLQKNAFIESAIFYSIARKLIDLANNSDKWETFKNINSIHGKYSVTILEKIIMYINNDQTYDIDNFIPNTQMLCSDLISRIKKTDITSTEIRKDLVDITYGFLGEKEVCKGIKTCCGITKYNKNSYSIEFELFRDRNGRLIDHFEFQILMEPEKLIKSIEREIEGKT